MASRPKRFGDRGPWRWIGQGSMSSSLNCWPDGVEAPAPEQVFLRCSDAALSAALAFGRANEGWRGCRAQPSDFVLEVVADVL